MKKYLVIILVLTAALSLAACQATDVVGKFAVTSFEALLNKIPENITSDEVNNGWALTSPTDERFIWGKDFSSEGTPDVMLEFDSQPFIDAGADPNKVEGWVFAKVPVMDEQGKKIEVEKLLKPFDLK
ncbi:MAG: hypothetical protein PHI04_07535 [Clostridiaceae bacterium]|nr:hypothetical protein [Clostridiaceae bacterium]